DLGIALVELGLQPGHITELGGAYRGEVLRMREENRPAVADPVVKANRPLGRFSCEIRCFRIDPEGHAVLLFPRLPGLPEMLVRFCEMGERRSLAASQVQRVRRRLSSRMIGRKFSTFPQTEASSPFNDPDHCRI